jgi:hypothetical protein
MKIIEVPKIFLKKSSALPSSFQLVFLNSPNMGACWLMVTQRGIGSGDAHGSACLVPLLLKDPNF